MNTRPKIILLNPPGTKPYSRDYFCSKVTKTGYLEHPVDLLVLTGSLYDSAEVLVIDAVVEDLSIEACRGKILAWEADAIVFLSGLVSWAEDFPFMKQIKEMNPHILLIGMGDIFLAERQFLKCLWLDAYFLDFTGNDLLRYLQGRREGIKELVFRSSGGEIVRPYEKKTAVAHQLFEIPVPRHELFINKRYSFPFARHLPFTTVLTDFGCGFPCPFCIYGTLPFKMRTVYNVCAELAHIHKLGIQEIFFKDQTFAFDRERTISLCREMVERKWNFSWTCFLRANLVDSSLLSALKEAGCHTVIFGVESGNESILRKYKPGLSKKTIQEAFALCQRMGFTTVATFILGFPEDDKESVRETIDFAKELSCDYASFNLFVPKPLTVFASAREEETTLDQSGIASVRGNGKISPEELDGYRRQAIREFYCTPSYIINRLLKIESGAQCRMIWQNGWSLLKENFSKQK